jgi:hypothetical protein
MNYYTNMVFLSSSETPGDLTFTTSEYVSGGLKNDTHNIEFLNPAGLKLTTLSATVVGVCYNVPSGFVKQTTTSTLSVVGVNSVLYAAVKADRGFGNAAEFALVLSDKRIMPLQRVVGTDTVSVSANAQVNLGSASYDHRGPKQRRKFAIEG